MFNSDQICHNFILGFKFLYITRGSFTLSTYSGNNLIQATFRVHDIILVKILGGVKRNASDYFVLAFRYRVICSLLFSLLISQLVGGNQQTMSAFQHE